MAFMDANTWYLADGYDGTRVIKYDMNGKKLLQWGEKGHASQREAARLFQQRARHRRRPDDAARVRERPQQRPRAGVRREREVSRPVGFRSAPADEHSQHLHGRQPYSLGRRPGIEQAARLRRQRTLPLFVGTFGTCQGCQWGVHGFAPTRRETSTTAEVRTGRVQKYTPRKGPTPAFMVGKPWPGVW
jgi:hypothetical protein